MENVDLNSTPTTNEPTGAHQRHTNTPTTPTTTTTTPPQQQPQQQQETPINNNTTTTTAAVSTPTPLSPTPTPTPSPAPTHTTSIPLNRPTSQQTIDEILGVKKSTLGSSLTGDGEAPSHPLLVHWHRVQMRFQTLLDRSAPSIYGRWAVFFALMILYIVRVWMLQGFYIISYALGIYLLNLLIGFLTPQIDPELEGPGLPTQSDDEFRPFVRRLPEFKFWFAATRAVLFSLLATLFPFMDIPVFVPILVLYFCVLFFITMRRRIAHMIKYKYVPFSTGKKRYTGEPAKAAKDNK